VSIVSGGEKITAFEPSSPTMDRGIDQPAFPTANNARKVDSPTDATSNHKLEFNHTNNNTKHMDSTNIQELKIHKVARKTSSDESKDNKNNKTHDVTNSNSTNNHVQPTNTTSDKDNTDTVTDSSLELVDDYYSFNRQASRDAMQYESSGAQGTKGKPRLVLAADSNLLTGVTQYEAVQVCCVTNYHNYGPVNED